MDFQGGYLQIRRSLTLSDSDVQRIAFNGGVVLTLMQIDMAGAPQGSKRYPRDGTLHRHVLCALMVGLLREGGIEWSGDLSQDEQVEELLGIILSNLDALRGRVEIAQE